MTTITNNIDTLDTLRCYTCKLDFSDLISYYDHMGTHIAPPYGTKGSFSVITGASGYYGPSYTTTSINVYPSPVYDGYVIDPYYQPLTPPKFFCYLCNDPVCSEEMSGSAVCQARTPMNPAKEASAKKAMEPPKKPSTRFSVLLLDDEE
jgi:hypothetical protein